MKQLADKYKDFDVLDENCVDHPLEKVRFFCRVCAVACFSDCVVEHARHDFVLGDNRAAVEIRKTIQATEENVREYADQYESVLWATEKKMAEIEIYKQQELKRLSLAFQEIREAIFARERAIKKELHEKIKHAQAALKDDSAALQKILKDLICIKNVTTKVMEAVHSHSRDEDIRKVVQSSTRIKLLQADFDKMKSTTLTEYNLDCFVIGKD